MRAERAVQRRFRFRDSASRLGRAAALLVLLLAASCAARPPRGLLPPEWESWSRTTSLTLDYPIPGHENKLRIPRMNPLGFAYLAQRNQAPGAWNFPEGTLIAKDVYASNKPGPGEGPATVAAMLKAPKDPRARGGWLWFVKDLGTGKERVFTEEFCITCHENANEAHPYGDKNPRGEFRDYIFIAPEIPGQGTAASPPAGGSASPRPAASSPSGYGATY